MPNVSVMFPRVVPKGVIEELGLHKTSFSEVVAEIYPVFSGPGKDGFALQTSGPDGWLEALNDCVSQEVLDALGVRPLRDRPAGAHLSTRMHWIRSETDGGEWRSRDVDILEHVEINARLDPTDEIVAATYAHMKQSAPENRPRQDSVNGKAAERRRRQAEKQASRQRGAG